MNEELEAKLDAAVARHVRWWNEVMVPQLDDPYTSGIEGHAAFHAMKDAARDIVGAAEHAVFYPSSAGGPLGSDAGREVESLRQELEHKAATEQELWEECGTLRGKLAEALETLRAVTDHPLSVLSDDVWLQVDDTIALLASSSAGGPVEEAE